MTITNDLSVLARGAGGGITFRNRLINGNMAIDQRNSGASQTITAAAALAYTVDRWYAYCTGANVTGQRVSNTGVAGSTSQYAYQFTGASSVTAIGFAQRIEAVNSYDLAGTTATLSVNLSNSLLTTVTWTAYYASTTDTFGTLASPTKTQIATGTFTVSSTLTRYSATIAVPSGATTGIEIVFTVGAQTSGTWVIGNVQLEEGSAPTTFERRPIGHELMLCQRYYWQLNLNVAYASLPVGYSASTTAVYGVYLQFPVNTRSIPTVSFSGNSSWQILQISSTYTVSTISASTITAQSVVIQATTASSITTNTIIAIRDAGSGTAYVQISAEL
jgi:hypothetical protein